MNLRTIPIARLIEGASIYCYTPEEVIKGPSRLSQVTHIRFAITWVALREGWTTTQVGIGLGGRDHSTIVNARNRAEYILDRDPDFCELVDFLEACAKAWTEHGELTSVTEAARPNPFPLRFTMPKPPSKGKPVRSRKPKNRIHGDDRDAQNRRSGSLKLIAAIRREHPERCIAA